MKTPEPVPVGTVVDYRGSHAHGRYVITEHTGPNPDAPDKDVHYPDGVGYTIWYVGMEQRFGSRQHSVHYVRRGSITPVGTP
jgi:hypothetical protein